MKKFVVHDCGSGAEFACHANDAVDACMSASVHWIGWEKHLERIMEYGLKAYEAAMVDYYFVKEIDRAMMIQYVEWAMDGNNVNVLL